jgi:hypothetical protein
MRYPQSRRMRRASMLLRSTAYPTYDEAEAVKDAICDEKFLLETLAVADGLSEVGQITSRIGKSFVQLDTSNAVEIEAGDAVPGRGPMTGGCEWTAKDVED